MNHSLFTATNRRRFIRSGIGAFSSLALPNLLAQESKRKRELKICLKYSMIKDGSSTLDKFRLAREAGFEGIERDAPLDEHDLDEMKEASSATGVLIPGLVCPLGGKAMGSLDESVRSDGIQKMALALRQAKMLGGSTVLMYPGFVDHSTPYHLVYEQLMRSVNDVLPVARKTGIKIAIENVWNNIFLSPVEAAHFVDRINDAHLGWYFDIGNVARYGWPEHWIKALGKRIFKLDIKGYSASLHMKQGPSAGFNVEIGEDEIDWTGVMQAIDDVGYSGGWISAEVKGGGLSRLIQVRQQIERVLAL